MVKLGFRKWLEWGSPNDIRGEYWYDGDMLHYADGDIGDQNHEGIAVEHVVSMYVDEIAELAEELELDFEGISNYDQVYTEDVYSLIQSISEKLQESMSEQEADKYIMNQIGADEETYLILLGFGDPRLYAMKRLNWIAVRSNNVEVYGYDIQKQKEVADALNEIMDVEHGGQQVDPQQVEVSLYDHKTNRGWYASLAELSEQNVGFRTNQPITSTYNKQFFTSQDREENRYAQPQKSKINPWNTAAKDAGLGSELWRGTSESVRS
jgi:hypothetical protein